MSFEFDAPEDLAGGDSNRLSEPGTYHLVITDIREGEGPNGKACDGFTFEADVLAGTTEGCVGKTIKETLFQPNMKGTEDSQRMSRKKLAAFFIATDVMNPNQLGRSVAIDVEAAKGKQLIVEFDRQKDKDEKTGKYTIPTKYIQVAYANIYHVDDPDVKDIPKNADALGCRDDSLKHDSDWFAFKDKTKKLAKQSKQPAMAGASSSSSSNPTQFDAELPDDL